MLKCKNCHKESICSWKKDVNRWTLRSICCDAPMYGDDGKDIDDAYVAREKQKLRRRDEDDEVVGDEGLDLFGTEESD